MAAAPWRENWVLARDIKTHYVEAGDDGPTLVMLHGGGPGASGAAGFRRLIPLMSEHFRIYAPDQLSYGLTEAPTIAWPVLAHHSLVNHVRDWMDALCLDDIYLIGNSQGAYVAARYALDFPGRVRKLFMIGSGTIAQAYGLPQPDNDARRALRDFDGTAPTLRRFLEGIVYDKATVTDELVESRVAAFNRPGIPEMTKSFNEGRERIFANAFWRERFMLKGRLEKLSIPAMMVWGKQDAFAPVEMGYELEKLLPNVDFVYADDAGHQVQTDRPELVAELATPFFLGG